MKRTHKNWRTAESTGGLYSLKSEDWRTITFSDWQTKVGFEEQLLIDFWFTKEDPYEEGAKEILECYNKLHEKHHILINFMRQADIEPILRKHFSPKDDHD